MPGTSRMLFVTQDCVLFLCQTRATLAVLRTYLLVRTLIYTVFVPEIDCLQDLEDESPFVFPNCSMSWSSLAFFCRCMMMILLWGRHINTIWSLHITHLILHCHGLMFMPKHLFFYSDIRNIAGYHLRWCFKGAPITHFALRFHVRGSFKTQASTCPLYSQLMFHQTCRCWNVEMAPVCSDSRLF